jgi:hypothetical protein
MLNPQYFKTIIPAQRTPEQIKLCLERQLKDPDLQSISLDHKGRVLVAGRVLRFLLEVKQKPAGQTTIVGKGYWSRTGLILCGFLLFFPLAVIYLAVSWGAACRFNRSVRQVVQDSSASVALAADCPSAQQEPAVPADHSRDYIQDLERLAYLHQKGALSADEYATQKQRILEQAHP